MSFKKSVQASVCWIFITFGAVNQGGGTEMRMKMTKRIVALIMAMLLGLTAFYGCSNKEDEEENIDKGAVVNMFLSYIPVDLDPGKAYFDSSVMQYFGLIYEGLTTYNEKGKLEKVLAKEWKYEIDERDDQLKLQIKLNTNYWSDGIPVDADDFVYAWKRLLLPETVNPAASLLFDVKNAQKAKTGEVTIDEVGIYSVGDYILEVVFEENDADVEYFLNCTASPALLPLREDIVSKSDAWAQDASTILTNGPFSVKQWAKNSMTLERNMYYSGLNLNKNYKPWKFVTPYRIIIDASKKNEGQVKEYDAGNNFYVGEFSAETFDAKQKKIETQNELSTYTLLFNTNNALLGKKDIRKAISVAIDRNEIAKIVGKDVKPATGFVPTGVKDCNTNKDFRKKAGKLIAVEGDVSAAKEILKDAGLTKGGKFTIKYLKHDNGATWEQDVAEYLQSVCKEKLGFLVEAEGLKAKQFAECLNTGDYDILLMDWQALTNDALSFVMPFGTKTSGSAISVETEEIEYTPYDNGYSNKEYDKIIEQILAAKNKKTRSALYYEAEKHLIDNAVVAPLFFNTDCYLASNKLSGIKTNYFAQKDLKKMKLKNYKDYLPTEQE